MRFDPNPFHWPAAAAAGVAVEGATAGAKLLMTGLWAGALWLMGFVFKIEDAFLDPDLSSEGPIRGALPLAAGIAVTLFFILAFGQLILAALRRDLSSLGTVFTGMFGFTATNVVFLTYAAALMTGISGLTKAILKVGLHVETFGDWAGAESWPRQIGDIGVTFVLGMSAIYLIWPACIAHLVVMLTRAVAMMVLVATHPIAAAGLVGESTSRWFWISVRWFHAAAFIPPLTALVLGLGVQMANATTQGAGNGAAAAGAAVVGSVTIAISAVAPLALFRLLAFVDPNTTTGQNFRAALGSYGGLSGILTGKGGRQLEQDAANNPTSDQPSTSGGGTSPSMGGASTGDDATTAAEQSAQSDNSSRTSAALGALGSAVGAFASVGDTMMNGLDTALTQGTDALDLGAVGHPQYYYGTARPPRQHSPSSPPSQTDETSGDDTSPTNPATSPTDAPDAPTLADPTHHLQDTPAPVAPPTPPPPPGGWSGSEDDPHSGFTPGPSSTPPNTGRPPTSGAAPAAGAEGGGAAAAASEAEAAAVLLL